MELQPGHYDTGAAQERTIDKQLSVEQRGEVYSHPIIVVICLARAVFGGLGADCAWEAARTPVGRADKKYSS